MSAINTRQLSRPAGVSWHRGCGDQGADGAAEGDQGTAQILVS